MGGALVVVGSGSPAQARQFAEEESIADLVTDPSLEAYRRAGMKRGVLRTLGLTVLKNALRAHGDGHRQRETQGDLWQLGGVLVVSALEHGGRLHLQHAASAAGEPTDLSIVVAAMRAASSTRAPAVTPAP